MKRISLVLTWWLFSAAAGAGSEEEILEAAKRDSTKYCAEYSKEGCEFFLTKTAEGWSVTAFPIHRTEKGDRVYAPGAFTFYIYDNKKQLLRTMPGL